MAHLMKNDLDGAAEEVIPVLDLIRISALIR